MDYYTKLNISNDEMRTEICSLIEEYKKEHLSCYPCWNTLYECGADGLIVNIAINVIDSGVSHYTDFCKKFIADISFLKKYGYDNEILKNDILNEVWRANFDYKGKLERMHVFFWHNEYNRKVKTISQYMVYRLFFVKRFLMSNITSVLMCILWLIIVFSSEDITKNDDIRYLDVPFYLSCIPLLFAEELKDLKSAIICPLIIPLMVVVAGIIELNGIDPDLYTSMVPTVIYASKKSILFLFWIPYLLMNREYFRGPVVKS